MRRHFLIALGAMMALSPAAAAAQNAESVLGLWKTQQQHGVVEIYRCGQAICGRIVDGDPLRANPDQRDIHNRNSALRNRRVMHLPVLQNLTGGPDKWTGGPVYDPVTGEGAGRGSIALAGPDTLKVQGCVALFFCRTQTWTRAR